MAKFSGNGDKVLLAHGTFLNVFDAARKLKSTQQRLADVDFAWHERLEKQANDSRDWPAQIDHLNQLISARPAAPYYQRRAHANAESGNWQTAFEDFENYHAIVPNKSGMLFPQALTRLGANDLPGYRAACDRMRQLFASSTDANDANKMAWVFALHQISTSDLQIVLERSHFAIAKARNCSCARHARTSRPNNPVYSCLHQLSLQMMLLCGKFPEEQLRTIVLHLRLDRATSFAD